MTLLNEHKIILDLCGGTGSWSKPYKDNGYDVRLITLPDNDVRFYEPPENVYGILAAPPCDQFSFAKTTGKPRDLKSAYEIVSSCLNIIAKCQYKLDSPYAKKTTLQFWALENPKGLLRRFFGSIFQKKTL
jgi:site-specific DNA-cytosine methylase